MQSSDRFTGDPTPEPNPGLPRGGHVAPAVSPFGRLLKRERLAAGLRVRELAARSGVSARAIEYLEGGQTLTPRRATRQQLAHGLQLGGRARHHFIEGPHDAPAHAGPIRHNLPNPLSSFVARAQEQRELVRVLSGRTRRRLITLYGPGGIGKTRLALTVAAAMLEQFPGGVYLIDLAPIESGPWIEVAIANALGVRDDNPTALGAMIMAHLRDRRTLLILDNCEHLIAPCAALVGRLLASAPGLQIVATTREPLGLPGELVRRLPALSLPPAADPEGAADEQRAAIAASEAVQLFVARAALVSPGFTLRAENAVAIAAICRRLDGLPLALELAASRLTALPLDTLAAELDLALQVGGGGRRGVHTRQRTIRATLDWSYALLSVSERALLRRLASFAGTWSASAAAAVCGDQSTPDLPRLLAALVAKSLINVETGGQQAADTPGEARYRLLETVRQYARDRLREANEEGVQGSRLCDWAIETLESVESPLDGGPDGTRWLARVETELTNLRAARVGLGA
ncbi:MAG: hypothetical protein AVDCRST_MAG18-495 [uncultured Thermomicrobiales bacterium]|uniref:HTH cro/C1-type domain-containing protein n=1 Tax=uncultured Thermomicrobiales bacterium TaxID=1645740 RepID=A0A6J4UKV4_9BACT|nr:MAG: hypothetical protein AVDCRST_MAG18-495 [uncultured Thermomicrobiales bacterium]